MAVRDDFRLIPGNPNPPPRNKKELLPEGHWLRTGRYVDGDSSHLGRRKETVQEAIFAFRKTGRKFPDQFDWDNPEHYFIQRMEQRHINDALSGGFETSAKEKHQGWFELPIVWPTASLEDAVSAYTNVHHERGAGKKYDEFFSFGIKVVAPDWPCILTLHAPRGSFPAIPRSKYAYDLKIHGLSPWEKKLKEMECELFRDLGNSEKSKHDLGRLLFADRELYGFLYQFQWGWDPVHWESLSKVCPSGESRRLLVKALREIGDKYDRASRKWSSFDHLLNHSYMELVAKVEQGLLEEKTSWVEADDLLQNALCGKAYSKSGTIYSMVSGIPPCRSLLELMKVYWEDFEVSRLNEIAKILERKSDEQRR